MKKIVYKSKAIQAVILMIAAGLLLSLWPLRIWKETVTSSILPAEGTVTEQINNEKTVLQSFTAQYDHLGSIKLFLGSDTQGESFFVRVLNEEQVMIAEEEVAIRADRLPGYVDVLMDIDTEVGKMYHCIIEGNDSTVYLGCEIIPMTDVPFAGQMYYDNQPVDGMNLVADYCYSVPLRKGKVFLFGGLIALIAALCMIGVQHFYGCGKSAESRHPERRQRDSLITVEKAFRCVMNPVVGIVTLLGLGAVLMGAYGHYALDNTVFFVSILLLSGILFYGINHNRNGQNAVFTWDYLSSHFPDLLQSVCIAGAIAACCEYMNGLYDIHHAIAERKEMLWFALAVIAMFKWKEIVNLYNLVYLAAAGIAGYFYYQNEVAALAQQTIKETEIGMHMEIIRNTAIIGILLGLILIRTIIGLCRKKLLKPDLIYSGLMLVFFAAIIICRNGRWWTVTLAVSFILFYLTYGMWEHRERLLINICRGIVLQFIYVAGFSLLHRPYATYKTARYPLMFHTVTITATYLTMVECAAIVLLLAKFARSRKLRELWKELVLFGVVSSYILFTMARTGFLAVAATLLFALIIMTVGKGKERLLNILRGGIAMVLAVLVCLPITFTAQRTLPVLASDPVLSEIESFPDEVMRGRKLDSLQFMRVGRFIDIFSDKIFNLPEGTFDIYGETVQYRRTHDILGQEIDPADTDAISMEDVFTGKVTLEEAQAAVEADRAAQETAEPEAAGAEDAEDATAETSAAESDTSDAAEDIDVSATEAESVKMTTEETLILQDIYESEEETVGGDYTNGRTDIFKSYIQQLNMTGHEEMGAVLPDGSIATHAHDIYLQVAYDHGIPTGILFVLVGLITWIKALIYYFRRKEKSPYTALPAVVTTAVAIAGIVEWIFHLSNPCGLILMLVTTPLVFGKGHENE